MEYGGAELEHTTTTARDIRARRASLAATVSRFDWLRVAGRLVALILADLTALFLAIFLALSLKALVYDDWNTSHILEQTARYLPVAALVTLLLFATKGLYGPRETRPGLATITASLFQVMIVALIFGLAEGEEFSSYYIFWGTLIFAVVLVSSFRLVYDKVSWRILQARSYERRALLVGHGKQVDEVAAALAETHVARYATLGYISLDDRPESKLRDLGSVDDLPALLDSPQLAVDEVVITDPDFPQDRAVELVERCHQRGILVRIAPTTMEILTKRAEFVPGQVVPLFELRPPVFSGFDFVVKRAFDLAGSFLTVLLLSPLLALIALAVKLSSHGPVLYRSRRRGIGQRPFDCLKFRTMYHDADERQADLEHLNEADGALFKVRRDPRITPVGGFLRRFSLDELPQLFNVLGGEMSLVGPRPLPERDYERLQNWHKKRYLVLPGITGLWQVSGRADLDFDELVRLDFFYLESWSVLLDLSILVKTLPAVLTRRGAF